ncbi:Methionyl-tRNA synthetase [hydrothermal vent metagenome]|uniref:methionine--tRNA ligase n=1 Tax=hydrothermal vent metagenome TaxID=652676 RepID=A0A3B1DU06_9ZZZZ
MAKKVYITTPIYYVNDKAHIGHAYTTIIADVLAIYTRLIGEEVFFLTGTDEHGQKIEQSAKKNNKTPKEYADIVSKKFKDLWDEFDITYDYFIRTTDEDHKKGIQKAFLDMYKKGDIYKDKYEGNYCVSCETYYTQLQLIEQELCPSCGRATEVINEESYFFKLSKYQDRLLAWYEENDTCILPVSKKSEIVNFVKEGLRDLSITRTSFDWGVKLPKEINDDKHVMYVWLDALFNYLTAIGYGDDNKNMDFWPAKIHLVGKDILRFHAIYWPAFLMSLDIPLPDHIAAHGWWTREGQKMSKSKGNVIDPRDIANAYGLEEFRYFMLREVPFGQDGDFSQRALVDRINSNLSNDLGNLLNRITGMADKYFDLDVGVPDVKQYYKEEIKEIDAILCNIEEFIYSMQLHNFLKRLWEIIAMGNKMITQYEPWTMMKEDKVEETKALIVLIANILSKVAILLHAVMPKKTTLMASGLNIQIDTPLYKSLICDNNYLNSFKLCKIDPLFPRIDDILIEEAKKEEEKKEIVKDNAGIITIEQFLDTKLKIGLIKEVEEITKSKKLYKMVVDLGEGKTRQIIAGIKEFYTIEELVNTQVCVVSNLKPAKLMGMLSEGMLLAARDDDGLSLIRPERNKKIGTLIK